MSDNPLSRLTEPYGISLNSFVFDENAIDFSLNNAIIRNRLDSSVFNANASSYSNTLQISQQFREKGWSSSLEPANKEEEVVLQFNFDEERSFNRISFELSDVPQLYSVYYFDLNRNKMVLLTDVRNNSVQGQISGNKDAFNDSLNFWIKQSFMLPTIKTNLLEIRIKRNPVQTISLGMTADTSYRLRLRKLSLRWHMISSSEVSNLSDDTINLIPSDQVPRYKQVSFAALDALNLSDDGFWKSPPLGPDSVYPFMIDLRDPSGNAQVFDTIKLIPMFTGSLMNVYYSNDEAVNPFIISNNRKNLILNSISGVAPNIVTQPITINNEDWQEGIGLTLSNNKTWEVANRHLHLNTAFSVLVGMQLEASSFEPELFNEDQNIAFFHKNNLADLKLKFVATATTTVIDNQSIKKLEVNKRYNEVILTFTDNQHGFIADSQNFIKLSGISVNQLNGVWPIKSVNNEKVTLNTRDITLIPITLGDGTTTIGQAQSALSTIGNLVLAVGEEEVVIDNTQFVETYKYGIGFAFNKDQNLWLLFKARMGQYSIEYGSRNNIEYLGEFIDRVTLGNTTTSLNDSFIGTLSNLWIKQDRYHVATFNSFLGKTEGFMNGEGDKSSNINGHFNALLIGTFLQSYDYQFGPNSFYYNAKSWIPINKEFVLNTDTYKIEIPIKAKFVKLEFTKPVGRYYNPATLENVMLPIFAYPEWVKKWYIDNYNFSGRVGSFIGSNALFERAGNIAKPRYDYGLMNIKTAIEGSSSSVIFNPQRSGIDLSLGADLNNSLTLSQQIRNSSIHMRFPLAGPHNYATSYIPMINKQAFFYGIQSLQFIKTNQIKPFNNKVYLATAEDASWIDTNNGFSLEDNLLMAGSAGSELISYDFYSFSNFSTVQLGALSSPPIDLFSYAEINLASLSHLSRLNIDSHDEVNYALETSSNIKGSNDGQVVWLRRINPGRYGIQTNSVTLPSTIANTILTAGCRLRSLSSEPKSIYELRLQVKVWNDDIDEWEWKVAAVSKIKPSNIWSEYELTYSTQINEEDFRLQLIQTDFNSYEEIYIDMLGLWMSPFKFEIFNAEVDSELPEYLPVVFTLSNPLGLVKIPETNQFKLKITALIDNAWLSGWISIPHYINSPISLVTNIIKQNDWAVSDSLENRIPNRQIFFANDSISMIPKRYSIF